MNVCSIPDCGKPHVARGLCTAHYTRWRKHGDPLRGGPLDASRGDVQRFFRDVVLAYEGHDCLFWPFSKYTDGCGKIQHGGRTQRVPRLVCEHVNGPPPTPKHQAAHSCGNGHLACVTRRHLSWKTGKENQADRLLHGTDAVGEKNAFAKLTDADVRQIRALRGALFQREIAEQFGVSQSCVSLIHHGKTWGPMEDAS